MIHSPIFKEAKKGECFLVLDIGTEAVKSLIFQKENEKIVILGYSVKEIERFGAFNGRGDFEEGIIKRAVSKSVEETLQNFLQNPGKQARLPARQAKPKSIILGLPANILKARVVFKNLERKESKGVISREEEKEILKTALDEAQKEVFKLFAEKLGFLPSDIRFIHLEILEIKINGYKVPQLYGYAGENLDFRILTVFLPKHYLEKFDKIIKSLNLEILRITHPALNLTKVFGAEIPTGLFLDVGGDISQIFIIRDGQLDGIEEFEIGGNIFSRAISESLGISEKEARLLKEKYADKLLSEDTRGRIKEIFSQSLGGWFSALKSKLFSEISLIPQDFFLFGGGSLLPEVKDILEEGNWGELSVFKSPRVKMVSPKDLKIFEDRTNKLTTPRDISILLIAYA